MFFKPNLGMQGNIEEALKRNNQIRKEADKAKAEQSDTNALTLEIAADHEARLCEIELGV